MFNFFFKLISPVFAQSTMTDFNTKTPTTSLTDYISDVISWAIPVLGSIALLMFIWAGYIYITSQGNPDKINSAKEIVVSTLVGILLLFGIGLIVRQIGLT